MPCLVPHALTVLSAASFGVCSSLDCNHIGQHIVIVLSGTPCGRDGLSVTTVTWPIKCLGCKPCFNLLHFYPTVEALKWWPWLLEMKTSWSPFKFRIYEDLPEAGISDWDKWLHPTVYCGIFLCLMDDASTFGIISKHNGPLARYLKLWVAFAPGMPGTFSLSPRVSDPDMHHGTPGSLTSGFLWSRWRGKRVRHSPAQAQPANLRIWWEAHVIIERHVTRTSPLYCV